MGSLLVVIQAALFLLVNSEEPKLFDLRNFQPIFQEIKGLPSNQKGFTITLPSVQPVNLEDLTKEQHIQMKAQEEFRKSVAEANRQILNRGQSTAFQQFPFVDTAEENQQQMELARLNQPVTNTEIVQQLPFQDELLLSTLPTEKLDSFQTADTILFLPVQRDGDFNIESLTQQFDAQKFKEQAENARYSFRSAVADSVNDNIHIRQEMRDGLKLKGVYSYSDGYFKRTVHYVADENGYRVVKEESEPIGTGPHIDPMGKVDVSTQVDGSIIEYTIKGENLPPPLPSKHLRH